MPFLTFLGTVIFIAFLEETLTFATFLLADVALAFTASPSAFIAVYFTVTDLPALIETVFFATVREASSSSVLSVSSVLSGAGVCTASGVGVASDGAVVGAVVSAGAAVTAGAVVTPGVTVASGAAVCAGTPPSVIVIFETVRPCAVIT